MSTQNPKILEQGFEWIEAIKDFSFNWSVKTLQDSLGGSQFILYFCNQTDEQALGYILISPFLEHWEFLSLATHPNYLKQGIMTELVSHALQMAKRESIKAVFLEVHEQNGPALDFYKKNGFVINRTRFKYYLDGANALEMKTQI